MKVQQATVIGTRMSESDIAAYLGFKPDTFNREFTQLVKEICVVRGYYNKTISKKIKFYRLPESDIKALTDGPTVMIQVLKTGLNWQLDIAFMFVEFKEAQAVVNSKYPYGKMNDETRSRYVSDISDLLDTKFQKVDLLN